MVDVARRGVRARVVRTDLDRLLVRVVTRRVRARLGVGGGPAVLDGRVDGDGEHAVRVLQPGVVERDLQRVATAVPHEGRGHVVRGGRVTGALVDLRVVGVRRRDALYGLPGGVAQDDRAVLLLGGGESLEVEREGPGVAGVRRVQDDRFLHTGGGGGDLEVGVGEDTRVGDARAVGGALDGLGALQLVGDGVLFVRGDGDERGVVGLGREVDVDGVGLLVPPPVGTGPHIHVDGRPFALADLVVDRRGRDLSGDGPVGVVEHAVRTRGLGRVPLTGLGVEACAAGGALPALHGRLVRLVRGEFALALAGLVSRAPVRLGGGGGDMVLLPRRRARLLPGSRPQCGSFSQAVSEDRLGNETSTACSSTPSAIACCVVHMRASAVSRSRATPRRARRVRRGERTRRAGRMRTARTPTVGGRGQNCADRAASYRLTGP